MQACVRVPRLPCALILASAALAVLSLMSVVCSQVGAPLINRLRREWRRTTMESMHQKLRVKELWEAQEQVATFAVEQAKSLLLSLRLESQPAAHEVSESDLVEALGRVLPDEEICVVVAFLQSTAAAKRPPPDFATPESPLRPVAAGSSAEEQSNDNWYSPGFMTPQAASVATTETALDSAGSTGKAAGVGIWRSFVASQVAVGIAVLCDGPVDERLRICFEAFDELSEGHLGAEAIVSLLHAVYRTYYKEPPTDEEVRTAAEVMFLNVASSPPRLAHAGPRTAGGPKIGGDGVVGVDAFVVLASSQPTLVQCFAMRGKRPLLTPRGVDQRKKMPQQPSSTLDQVWRARDPA